PYPGGEVEAAGCEQRVVLAETVSGKEIRWRMLLDARQEAQRVDDEQRRLHVAGVVQAGRRTVQAQRPHVVAEDRVGLRAQVRVPVDDVGAHTAALRTLAREHPRRGHPDPPLRLRRRPAAAWRTGPSGAG